MMKLKSGTVFESGAAVGRGSSTLRLYTPREWPPFSFLSLTHVPSVILSV